MDTVGELKKKIREKTGLSALPPLFVSGRELSDDAASLLEYDVVPDACPGGPVVSLGGTPWAPFKVRVQLPNGRLLQESVGLETTIAQLKGRITAQVGIPYLTMKLLA